MAIPEPGKRANCSIKVNLDQGATDGLLSLRVKTRNGVGVAKGSVLYLDGALVDVACGGTAWKRMKMDFFAKPVAVMDSPKGAKGETSEMKTEKDDKATGDAAAAESAAGNKPQSEAAGGGSTPAAPAPVVKPPPPKPAEQKGETKPNPSNPRRAVQQYSFEWCLKHMSAIVSLTRGTDSRLRSWPLTSAMPMVSSSFRPVRSCNPTSASSQGPSFSALLLESSGIRRRICQVPFPTTSRIR